MQGIIYNVGNKGSSNLNVFAQLAEPKTKDGIWIKTKEILLDEINYTKLADIPYNFYSGSAVAIDTDVYLFGSRYTSYHKYAYKYDTLTNTYTRLADIPYEFYLGSAVAIGTDIYLFGSYNSSYYQTAYKYNTLTDTYTQLENIPYVFYNGSAVAVGTDIYLFGSGVSASSSYQKYTYKYDTLTNTYTKLTNIPKEVYNGLAVAVGTDIYLLGGFASTGHNETYKYDTLTDTYISLTPTPYGTDNDTGIVSIDTNIYIFGGSDNTNYQKYVYKYNTLTDTYIQLTDIPYNFDSGRAVAIGNNVYLFGSNYVEGSYNYPYQKYAYKAQIVTSPAIQKYKYSKIITTIEAPTTLENQSIYILYGNSYKTKLSEQIILNFIEAFLYKDNKTQEYPVYYGDGEKWNKI